MNQNYNEETGAVKPVEVKKKKRKRRNKSYIAKVLNNKDNIVIPLLVLMFLGAFILDVLRIIKNFLITIFLLCIIMGCIAFFIVWVKIEPYYTEYKEFATKVVDESNIETFRPEESTYIYDSSNNLLAKLRGNQDSVYLEYNDIPPVVIDAFVAVEDRSFWDNPGIDIKGLIRVGVNAIKTKGDEVHGASTITQQLARNIFLTHEVSLERKGKEMLISLELTKKYSKREIMEFYVNNICYANAFYGLEAASNGYFNKSSSELTLSQLVYLCAIPNSPEYYNPYKYPEIAISRRDKILGDMYELDLISKSEYDEAISEEITIEKPKYEFNDYQSTFAIDCATRYIMKENGFEFRYSFEDMTDYNNYKKDYDEAFETAKYNLVTGGYKIYTTLNSYIQEEMQMVLDEQLAFDNEVNEENGIYALQGAITVVDNETGKVVAVVGGRSQEENNEVYSLNRAYQSARQPGSTIKPLAVYTPALTLGCTPNTTVFNISIDEAKKKGVDVQTLSGEAMTLRSALEKSKNGVAWQIFDKITPKYGLSFMEKMQFSTLCPNDYFNATSLGGMTYGVTTVEMAGAYATLANHGYFREPTCINKILDKDDNDIYRNSDEIAVYPEKEADTMVDMMTGVLKVGTAAKLNWYKSTDMVAACKTGTTNDSKDGWLCGFTPQYTVSVWVGYDQPRTLNNLYGATYPGQIWKECMLKLIEGFEPITEFDKTEAYYELSYEHSELLPESAYDLYLPGRSDDELLSDGYTVLDYRTDRVIGEQIPAIISQLYNLDRNDPNYLTNLASVYSQGCSVINTVYSQKYKAELQTQLDAAYNSCYYGQ